MINIATFGDSSIKFTFTENDHYLYNGEITVPLNSLILVIDESDMATFRKIDGDLFLSFLISNSNFASKAALEEFYQTSMVGSTGGSGGVTSGEVQTMIDESISGKVDTSAFTAYSASTDSRIAEDEEVTAAGLNALNESLNGKQATLVSGTNIKTINNESLLGSGNIDIQGGGATYSGGSGINIDSANTITAVYKGWNGERVQYLYAITTPFYMHKSDDCGWRSSFDVFFEINGAQSQVNFDVLTHTYVLVEGDSSWNDYVDVEWDNTYECFKATPNTQINVSDASCARFSRLQYVGATENAIDNAFDEIESINNSAIGNIEFGTRDSYNDLYLYPSTLNGEYINMYTVGLEGGLKVMGSNISTQMQSTPYKWVSGVTIGDSETSTFNAPSSAVTFNISRNPSEYLYAIDVNGSGYVFLDSNGDNPDPSNYSVVIVNGSVTVSALSTDKYITKITDSQGELSQYVSDVQYWGYEVDTIPNVVLNINDTIGNINSILESI